MSAPGSLETAGGLSWSPRWERKRQFLGAGEGTGGWLDERVAGGRRGSFLAAGVCPSGALGSPAGAHVSGEPMDGRMRLDTGQRAGGGSWALLAPPGVSGSLRWWAGGGRGESVSAPGLLLDLGWGQRPGGPGWVVLWKFVPFDQILAIPLPTPLCVPPVTTNPISFSMNLFIFEV